MNGADLSPEIFTADYVGEPGRRSFYVQARGDFGTRSYEIEKQQVRALADKLRELLVMIDPDDTINRTEPSRDPALQLDGPVNPDWRVGTIGLAYEENADVIVVLFQPLEEGPGDEAEAEAAFDSGSGDRVILRRDQVRSFVLHASAIVSEGRPVCRLCGLPKDPAGHKCPASNGHRLTG